MVNLKNIPIFRIIGAYYDLQQDSISFYDEISQQNIVNLPTMDSIGGRLSMLYYKINKLEKQN